MRNKKGFTLIELLAVIIILGILMLIAVPAVTKYIDDSRKSGYVSSAKNIAGGVRNLVNSGKMDLDDPNTTYYVDCGCIKMEGSYESPYDEFSRAYVVVTASYDGHDYYWTSVDKKGIGVKEIISIDNLSIDNIKEGLTDGDIATNRGLDSREKIVIVDSNCQKGEPMDRGARIDSATGELAGPIIYPAGKKKETVVTGDLVKIGEEEFYVIKRSGDDLYLLTHYNLNVGSDRKTDVPEGIQNSGVRAYVNWAEDVYGAVEFSSTNYWNDKVGTVYSGQYCSGDTYTPGVTCAYVYDSNSTLYPYVENYKRYLEGLGATIKDARLLRYEELIEIGWTTGAFWDDGPLWIQETSFWLGSAADSSAIWRVRTRATFLSSYYAYDTYHGVRPVIVV